MKLIVPFDTSVSPPKRFWSALWKPAVQPENPASDIETMRRSMVPGAPHVILDQKDHLRVRTADGVGAWPQLKRAFGAIGEWFARRDAAEREEQSAAAGGLEALEKKARLRDAQRSRHVRM